MGKGADNDGGVDAQMKKYKKRYKRMCLCAFLWLVIALLSLAVGIAMLVYFTKYWGDETEWKRGLAYFGVALLLVFVISMAVCVVVSVVLWKIYQRMNDGPSSFGKMLKPQSFAYGEAPYPQQPPSEPPQRTVPAREPDSPSKEPLNPGPQAQPTAPPSGKLEDVAIEMEDHAKF